MIKKLVTLAWLSVLSFICTADIYKYDFTSGNAPAARDGFLSINEKNSDDCRWLVEDAEIKEELRIEKFEANAKIILSNYTEPNYDWKYDGALKKSIPPEIYPIDLTAGYVWGNSTVTAFFPKVAPGEYRLWALCGNPGEPADQIWDVTLSAGENSGNLIIPANWEMGEISFDVNVEQGGFKLKIDTSSRWLLNCMVLVPVDEWKTVEAGLIRNIREEVFFLPKEVQKRWTIVKKTNGYPEPAWTDAQKAAGAASFVRHWSETVWPEDFPRDNELEKTAKAFAAWGELEPLNFVIHPLKDFEKAELRLEPLELDDDNRIPLDCMDARLVRYMYVRSDKNSFGVCYKAPDVLEPWKTVPLVKGENIRVVILVRVPLSIKAGVYKGKAVMSLDGTEVGVPLELRVLPITLVKDENLTFGAHYIHPFVNMVTASDTFSTMWWQNKAEGEFREMQKAGLNSVILDINGIYKSGRFVYNFDTFRTCVELCRRHGFNRPLICRFSVDTCYSAYHSIKMGNNLSTVAVPREQFFKDITNMVKEIQEEAARNQWPEIIFYPVHEPGVSDAAVEFTLKLLKAIKKVPNARTFLTADPAHERFQVFSKYVDIWCSRGFSIPREKILEDAAKKKNVEYWINPNHIFGENDHTPLKSGRMTCGFAFWNAGYKGLMPWSYQENYGSQWNYLDGASSDVMNRTDMYGNPVPVMLWLACVEGIDDGRYINTLEKLIARATAKGYVRQAKEAQQELDLVRKAVPVQEKYSDETVWNGDTFDVYRWLLSQQIVKLQKLF